MAPEIPPHHPKHSRDTFRPPERRTKTQPPVEPSEDDASLASIQLKLDRILDEQRSKIAKDTDALESAIGKAQEQLAAQAQHAVTAVGGLMKRTRMWFVAAGVIAGGGSVGGVFIATQEPNEKVADVQQTVEQQGNKSEEQAKDHDRRLGVVETTLSEVVELLAGIRADLDAADEPAPSEPEPQPKPKRKRQRGNE